MITTNFWSLFFLFWTVIAYVFAKKLHQKYPKIYFSPAVTVPFSTIILMVLFGISYTTYAQDTQWIIQMIAPATVAFAIPIYRFRTVIKENLVILLLSVTIGMSVGVLSAYECAQIFHFDDEITHSLVARSISTPFAMILAEELHGSAALVSLFTAMTGFIGMILGDFILAITRIKHNVANGAAFGNGAHAFGTVRAQQRHAEEGVIASLTMIIAGILMVLIGPVLIPFLF